MKHCKTCFAAWVLSLALIMVGCGLMEEPKPKSAPLGLITTPSAYYSTPKARYLGQKYKANLDRLVERIVRNQKTANLQFANNIASVGGIGFFTHSAATIPDERYLEVVLAAPDAFEINGEYSAKVNRLFELYGIALLSILASDSEIYQEKEVSGYGLNLSWRKITHEPTGPRVTLEKAVAYFPKQTVRGFLRQEMSQNDLLRETVIFAVEEDGPMSLVSYRPQDPKPDSRPPIQEETLTGLKIEPKSEKLSPSQPPSSSSARVPSIENRAEDAQAEQVALVENPSPAIQPLPVQKREDAKAAASVLEKLDSPAVSTAKSSTEKARQESAAEKRGSDKPAFAAPNTSNESPRQSGKASPPRIESASIVPLPVAKPVEMVPSVAAPIETPRERSVSERAASQYGGARERTDEIVTKSDLSEKKTQMEIAPNDSTNPASVVPPPTAGMQAARQEQVGETKVEQQITDPGKVPEPSVPVPLAGESKSQPVIVAPKPQVKAPNVARPGIVTPSKEQNVSEIKSPSASVDKAAAVKTPDQSKAFEERKLESVIAIPKSEVKGSTAGQTAPTKVTAAKEDGVSVTKSENPVVAKTEAPVPDQPKAIEERKPEVVIAAPKPEPAAPAIVTPAPAKPTPAKEVRQRAVVAKTENMKALDQPNPVQEKKPDLTVAAPKVDVRTLESKSPGEAAIKQKESDLSLRPQSVEERKPEIVSAPTKAEIKAPEVRPVPTEAAPAQPARSLEKPPNERIALLGKKPIEAIPEKKPLARPAPKPLEGYIVQLSFSVKGEAQRWAEKLTERGYAVSMTEAGSGGAFRVRIGNFPGRNEAERQLKTLAQDGLKGIVLNLPQAYRPEVSPAAEAVGQTISGTQ